MKEGGFKLARIRDTLMDLAKPGVTLLSLDQKAKELIRNEGGTPSFETVDGYHWATCLCVDDVIVHGIPTQYRLNSGDLLTIDVGLLYKGFHTDTAWTITVGEQSGVNSATRQLHEHFRTTGETALAKAIQECRIGKHIGDISKVIQQTVENAGYHVVRVLVGHGVGKALHEEPQVPGYISGDIARTPEITDGLTIAIEVIYTEGSNAVGYKGDDGWSIATRDGSLSAVYEHTVAATPNGPIILTPRPV